MKTEINSNKINKQKIIQWSDWCGQKIDQFYVKCRLKESHLFGALFSRYTRNKSAGLSLKYANPFVLVNVYFI